MAPLEEVNKQNFRNCCQEWFWFFFTGKTLASSSVQTEILILVVMFFGNQHRSQVTSAECVPCQCLFNKSVSVKHYFFPPLALISRDAETTQGECFNSTATWGNTQSSGGETCSSLEQHLILETSSFSVYCPCCESTVAAVRGQQVKQRATLMCSGEGGWQPLVLCFVSQPLDSLCVCWVGGAVPLCGAVHQDVLRGAVMKGHLQLRSQTPLCL